MAASTELQPAHIIIFGITGDLAARKLLPALYHLFSQNDLHDSTRIIGISRREVAADELLKKVQLCVNELDGECNEAALTKMHNALSMVQLDPENDDDYEKLKKYLNQLDQSARQRMQRLFYLSIPPKSYRPIVRNLGTHGLNEDGARLLVEKPFGSDYASAQELLSETSENFDEQQIYRIDHYLAKETAQNILTFRANNPVFQAAWNNQFIDSVLVTAHESIGIEGRSDFYEGVGALRDLIQSHLLQLLALATMEMPENRSSDDIHRSKQTLLDSIAPADPNQSYRAQYEGYKEESGNSDSQTETFARITVSSNHQRWQNVPFTIETGKALRSKRTDIAFTFKPVFGHHHSTKLVFRIQPNEGIHLELLAKKPGLDHDIQSAAMDFSYTQSFKNEEQPDAYERVFADAIRGDQSLFTSSAEVLSAWRIVQPVLDSWNDGAVPMHQYPQGSSSPAA